MEDVLANRKKNTSRFGEVGDERGETFACYFSRWHGLWLGQFDKGIVCLGGLFCVCPCVYHQHFAHAAWTFVPKFSCMYDKFISKMKSTIFLLDYAVCEPCFTFLFSTVSVSAGIENFVSNLFKMCDDFLVLQIYLMISTTPVSLDCLLHHITAHLILISLCIYVLSHSNCFHNNHLFIRLDCFFGRKNTLSFKIIKIRPSYSSYKRHFNILEILRLLLE